MEIFIQVSTNFRAEPSWDNHQKASWLYRIWLFPRFRSLALLIFLIRFLSRSRKGQRELLLHPIHFRSAHLYICVTTGIQTKTLIHTFCSVYRTHQHEIRRCCTAFSTTQKEFLWNTVSTVVSHDTKLIWHQCHHSVDVSDVESISVLSLSPILVIRGSEAVAALCSYCSLSLTDSCRTLTALLKQRFRGWIEGGRYLVCCESLSLSLSPSVFYRLVYF